MIGHRQLSARGEPALAASAAVTLTLIALSLATCSPNRLASGASVVGEIDPGQSHDYSLDLRAGSFVHVVIEQRGVDVETRLIDPAGNPIIKGDRNISYRGFEPLVAVAAVDGIHTLTVSAFPSDRPAGSYILEVQALRPASADDRARGEAALLLARGVAPPDGEPPEETLANLEGAVSAWRQIGDPFWEGEAVSRLAVYRYRGDRPAAIRDFSRSAGLFGEAGDPVSQAVNLNQAALALFDEGQTEMAIHRHEEALELARAAADRKEEATATEGLGLMYRNLGKMQQALSYYRDALDLWDPRLDRSERARTLHNLGVINRILGRPELGRDYLTAAVRGYRELDHPFVAASINQLGRLYQQERELIRAVEHYREALELRREAESKSGQANTLANLGVALLSLNELDEALRHLTEASRLLLELDNPRLRAKVLLALGSLYGRTQRAEEALDPLREALEILRSVEDPAGEAECLRLLAAAEADRGEFEAARDASASALDLIEQVRLSATSPDVRSSYFSTAQHFFEAHVDLLMTAARQEPGADFAAEALHTSERARARSLSEMLLETGAEIRREAPAELLAREAELQERLNETAGERKQILDREDYRSRQLERLEQELRGIAEELDAVWAEIRRQSPSYANLTRPELLRLDGIRRLLDDDTLLLDYEVAAGRSFLWAVTSSSLLAFELPGREEIERVARRAHEQLGGGRLAEGARALRSALCDVSDTLLSPARDLLADRRLVLVLDEALQLIPFAALPDPGADCSDAEPLIVGHEIAYLPSATTLAILRAEAADRRPASGSIAVLADPVYSATDPRVDSTRGAERGEHGQPAASCQDYTRLEFSRSEAEAILELTPAPRGRSFLDFAADKGSVLGGELAGYRFVHFAAHGILDTEHPELSGLVLSCVDEYGEERDGFLRAHELYALDLPAELVVLSACQTGLGKEVRGEGIVGLPRAFMYAGAQRVLVSLWSVSDRSTSQLMRRFYRGMWTEGLAPAAALRQAQIEMWRLRPSPFYWAAFVLQGEWLSPAEGFQ